MSSPRETVPDSVDAISSADTLLSGEAGATEPGDGAAGGDGAALVGGEPAAARYDLGGELARGAMGRIRTAVNRRLDRTVAVKELIGNDAYLQARFAREAQVTARLQHPGIVPIYDAGELADGRPFYSMRLVAGRSLDAAIAEAGSAAERLALLPRLLAAVEALAYAHSQRVIHRDLKPLNILCGPFGETVVIDWGLAKDLASGERGAEASAPPDAGPADSGAGLTVHGQVIGTPAYMPPEQAAGLPVDERADVYSLGAILYQRAVRAGSLRRRRVARASAPGRQRAAGAAVAAGARGAGGPPRHRRQGDGARGRRPLSDGAGAGGGPAPLAGGPARRRPPLLALGAGGALRPPAASRGHRRRGAGGGAGRDRRDRLCPRGARARRRPPRRGGGRELAAARPGQPRRGREADRLHAHRPARPPRAARQAAAAGSRRGAGGGLLRGGRARPAAGRDPAPAGRRRRAARRRPRGARRRRRRARHPPAAARPGPPDRRPPAHGRRLRRDRANPAPPRRARRGLGGLHRRTAARRRRPGRAQRAGRQSGRQRPGGARARRPRARDRALSGGARRLPGGGRGPRRQGRRSDRQPARRHRRRAHRAGGRRRRRRRARAGARRLCRAVRQGSHQHPLDPTAGARARSARAEPRAAGAVPGGGAELSRGARDDRAPGRHRSEQRRLARRSGGQLHHGRRAARPPGRLRRRAGLLPEVVRGAEAAGRPRAGGGPQRARAGGDDRPDGEALDAKGESREALVWYREHEATLAALVARHPDHAEDRAHLALAQGRIAIVLERTGDHAGAAAARARSLATYAEAEAGDPERYDWRVERAKVQNQFAETLLAQPGPGRRAEARAYAGAALATFEALKAEGKLRPEDEQHLATSRKLAK